MKKYLLSLFALFTFSAFASLPQSLAEYIAANPSWKTDISSKSFMATRCSVINILAAERSGANPSTQYLKESFNESSTIFVMYSDFLYTLGGGQAEQFKNRMTHWADVYGQEAVENINTYNDMTHGEFGDDMMFCNKEFLNFVQTDIDNLMKNMK
jgi:hypothetical protein